MTTGEGHTESALAAEIQRAATVLVEKAVWRCTRAADMACFDFGGRKRLPASRGGTKEVGEYALHVQCPWRFTRQERILVGSQDLYYPADFRDAGEVPSDFDWDRDPNRRDKLLDSLFEDGTREFIVREVRASAGASLSILLSDDLVLDIFPADSTGGEHWRLFQPGQDKPHFVVTGNGIKR